MTESHDLIGSGEAAQILGVDTSTVSRWSDERLIPSERRLHVALKLPGNTGAKLFRRGDVEELRDQLAAEQQQEAAS